MAKNLFEQLTQIEMLAIGQLVGVDTEGPSFRIYMREVPPFPEGQEFTLGDAARAYLQTRLDNIAKAP